jgi:transcriptional antiterminator RfaH
LRVLASDVDSQGAHGTPSAGAYQSRPATFWNVAKIKPGWEQELPGYLGPKGFPTFSPTLLARNTKHHLVRAPLFVGYLFVRFDARMPGWHVVTRAVGVSYLLRGADGLPQPVPERVMKQLLAQPEITAPGVLVSDKADPAVGAGIRVCTGPFTSFVGSVVRMVAKDRVAVLLTIFDRSAPMELPISAVELV